MSSAASPRFGSGVRATRERRCRHQQRTRWVWQWPLMTLFMTKHDGRHCTPLSQTCRSGMSFDPKCSSNGIQNSCVAKRLVQELRGSLLESLFPDAIVFLTSDEDDGNLLPTTLQFQLKVKPGHSWHRDVEDQTLGRIQIFR